MGQACLSSTSASSLGSLSESRDCLLAGGAVAEAFRFTRFMHYKPQLFCLRSGYTKSVAVVRGWAT